MTAKTPQPGQLTEQNLHAATAQSEMLQMAQSRRQETMSADLRAKAEKNTRSLSEISGNLQALGSPLAMAAAWNSYVKDAGQRGVMFLDALRQRSDTVIEHNAEGAPPVLIYDSEAVMDGRDLPRPCNYFLLRILPPDGIQIDPELRPYVIIDPRAGHGAGIGGFKRDSQVGVALKGGHPVYFVAFRQEPEPGQTIAIVTDAEAAFLRRIEELHPKAPRPVVIGNCQGGWATAILAATNPDLTGPIVLNGAPMSYWGGKLGQDMMRYSGGLAGGALPAVMAGDMAGGIFDGADLVQNFETLNPGRNWVGNYTDLYQDVDTGVPRFLGFERWWGGFYLMTTEEMSWIVQNLFVGNRLSNNTAQLEPGRHIDLKNIRAPIICFASHGDNITPPAQALNWIMDTYGSEIEISLLGQRIIYMVHEQVGHLGIFVSSSIANREHSQMAETLANIEALPPGLFEMIIEDVAEGEGVEKSFTLRIAKRSFDDIIAVTGKRRDEAGFATVARVSEALVDGYEATLRPFVKAVSSPDIGAAKRQMHPMRVSRTTMNSGMPGMKEVEKAANAIRADRTPAEQDNPFLLAEKLMGEFAIQYWDMIRDLREWWMEMMFLSTYLSPWSLMFGASRDQRRTQVDPALFVNHPKIQMALSKIGKGSHAEGLVRALILVAASRGEIRGDRLERSIEVMHRRPPMSDLSVEKRTNIIHVQTVLCHYRRDAALETLPKLLRTRKIREDAMKEILYVVGPEDEMAPATREMIDRIADVLGLARPSDDRSSAAAE